MSTTHRTTDHDTIVTWTQERGGEPARATGTGEGSAKGDDAGVIRIAFPDRAESDSDGLERTSWEKFFDVFESRRLAFLYQEETDDGAQSRFYKLVDREG